MKAHTKQNIWSGIRSQLFSQADALGQESSGGSWPIPVRKLVECRESLANRGLRTQIFFRPLWIDGCVVVTKSGFEIYVGCSRQDIEEYEDRYHSETSGRWLPSRVRFTIAHEIGHTLLFNSKNGQPGGQIKVDHPKILEALEESCQGAASRMLLPTDMVRAENRERSLFDPACLRVLADKARVSNSVVVRRMGEIGGLLGDFGAFAYAKFTEDGGEILSFASHPSVRPVFQNVLVNRPLSTFLRRVSKEFVANGGEKHSLVVEFPDQPDSSRRFEYRCENSESRGGHQGFFITARLLGNR